RCFDRFAFKKTCPFEFTRHVQPKADAKAWPSFLPSLVSQCEYQKGRNRFSGGGIETRAEGAIQTGG
ncbi:MAG: hypothetical protein ACK5Q1_08890, partial [Limnobacter sp.]